MWKCEYQKDETWKCEKVKASANIPPGLTDALNDATGPKANLNDRGAQVPAAVRRRHRAERLGFAGLPHGPQR